MEHPIASARDKGDLDALLRRDQDRVGLMLTGSGRLLELSTVKVWPWRWIG